MKTNYVFVCYGGSRNAHHKRYEPDRTIYVREQFNQLEKLEHNLDQITVVLNYDSDTPDYFYNFVKSAPSVIRNTPVVVIERPNLGISYGGFSHAYSLYRQEFDYYLFLEDDWCFTRDNFDKELIEEIQSDSLRCGYICGLASIWEPVGKWHSAISGGIIDSKALQDIWNRFGELPNSGVIGDYAYDKEPGQVVFSTAFEDVGWAIRDMRHKYTIPYNNDAETVWFYKEKDEVYMIPIDLLGKDLSEKKSQYY